MQVIDAEIARRQMLEETPIPSTNEEPVLFDTAEIPWWAWIRRFHLPEVRLRVAQTWAWTNRQTCVPSALQLAMRNFCICTQVSVHGTRSEVASAEVQHSRNCLLTGTAVSRTASFWRLARRPLKASARTSEVGKCESMPQNFSIVPPQAEKLNGRACMVGYFLALGVEKLTGAGLAEQQGSFLGLLSLHLVVFAVLLIPSMDRIQVRKHPAAP
jgi:hypothetical protein